ncbi:unnamed protein product [Moneuplotes crassus]|uniref:Uncharacterized protein n=1 Tax=Euplotes crassus TaxID=5936 RepID=A0AAD1U5Z1_EUPCR|nr:unnamed protein product [Moneuplotes crassus]
MGCQASTSQVKKTTKAEDKSKAAKDNKEDNAAETQKSPLDVNSIKKDVTKVVEKKATEMAIKHAKKEGMKKVKKLW